MTELKQIQLGEEALAYIKTHLSKGGRLSRFLLEYLEIDRGSVLTYLPASVSDEDARDFYSGGKISNPVGFGAGLHLKALDGTAWKMFRKANTDEVLACHVQYYLRGGASRVCLLEDEAARPSDLYLKATEQILLFNEEILYWLSGQSDLSNILRIIHQAKSWRFVCVMAHAKDLSLPLAPRQQIFDAQMRSVICETETLAVDAYDGEGFLIWSPLLMNCGAICTQLKK